MPATEIVKSPKTRRDWRPVFLEAFAAHGTVTAACRAARVGRSTVYGERQRSETFALAWSDVECEVTDQLEQTALRLALAGDRHLIEFLLKARKPETYREQRFRIEHTGMVGGNLLAPLDAGERSARAARLLKDHGLADAS